MKRIWLQNESDKLSPEPLMDEAIASAELAMEDEPTNAPPPTGTGPTGGTGLNTKDHNR